MSESRRTQFERLVAEWAGRVHALAYRMLGRRTDAEDATQEVFLRLWERIDAYDPSRPFQPWIYRVATHAVLNRIRGAKRRDRREADAPAPRGPETTEDAVERREREVVVQEALGRVDGEDRALLAMHFYGGLTQAEVAEVLDVPRSTVQSRLRAALDALRSSLRGAGHLAVIPGLEEVMRASPPPPLPDTLVSSLLSIATPAAAGVAATVVGTVGGIVVTKKLLLAVAILAAFCVGGGFAAGYALRATPADDAEAASARAANALLVAENRRLEEEAARRGARTALAGSPSPAVRPAGLASADAAGGLASGASSGSAAAATPPEDVDWSRLGALLGTNADRLIALLERGDDGDAMKPEDKQMVMGLLSEYMRSSTAAKALSLHPFYDERVLPGLVVAIYGDTLGLSTEKRAALASELRALISTQSKTLDFEKMGRIEAFVARQKTLTGVLAAVGAAAGEEGKDRFEKLRALGESMLSGDHAVETIGWDGTASASSIGEKVVRRWKQEYHLDPLQIDAVRSMADRYAADALDVLRRRGADRPDIGRDDPASRAAELEMFAIQAGLEHTIFDLLTDKQRKAVRSEPPTLVVVHPGRDIISSMAWDGI